MRSVPSALLVVLVISGSCSRSGTEGPRSVPAQRSAPVAPSAAGLPAAVAWYRHARAALDPFAAPWCATWHRAGYRVQARIRALPDPGATGDPSRVAVDSLVVDVVPDPSGAVPGPADPIDCAQRSVALWQQHPLRITLSVWSRKSVFGAEMTYADVTVTSPLLPGVPQSFRSPVVLSRQGLNLPRLESTLGLEALARPLRFRMHDGGNAFSLADLVFRRTGPGAYLEGRWQAELRSPALGRDLAAWLGRCDAWRAGPWAAVRSSGGETPLLRTVRAAAEAVARDLCAGATAVVRAVESGPGDAVAAGLGLLAAARVRWAREVRAPLIEAARDAGTAIEPPLR